LNLSVLYRGCALPVAWVIIHTKQKGSWRPYWEGLLAAVAAVVPPDWKVMVTADQGLYADWLWTAIQDLGWHPLLRVSLQMGFRAEGEAAFAAIGKRVQRRGRGWKGRGEWSERGARLQGTLLVRWEKGYEEAMAVVTDLPKEEVEIAWYLMRFWIEDEYKDHKRGGWGWQHTKMEDPKRAERLWLAMAVAMQMAVLVGGLEEAKEEEPKSRKRREAVPLKRVGRPAKPLHKPRRREQSCLVRGQQSIQAAVMRAEALPQGYVVGEPWPKRTYRPSKFTGKAGTKGKKREANRQYKQRRRARGDEADQKQVRDSVQERRKRQRQAQRATKANRKAQLQQEREAERKRIQQEQATRRMQRREERVQIREERRLWHEEIQRERAAQQLRREERAARRSSLALGSPTASSKKVPLQHALSEPLEPP
ncbi:MAG: transposase, partial [Ktedonobacteraceae bacterium]